jgi:hypothetical protein
MASPDNTRLRLKATTLIGRQTTLAHSTANGRTYRLPGFARCVWMCNSILWLVRHIFPITDYITLDMKETNQISLSSFLPSFPITALLTWYSLRIAVSSQFPSRFSQSDHKPVSGVQEPLDTCKSGTCENWPVYFRYQKVYLNIITRYEAKLSLCLTKHYAIKTYGRVDV